MKKLLILFIAALMSANIFAKDNVFNYAQTEGVTIINDSTIVYYDTYKIVITEPSDVYTAIFKIPSRDEYKKGVMPKLMMMSYGSYVFNSPNRQGANYILYASRSFTQVLMRQTETIEY